MQCNSQKQVHTQATQQRTDKVPVVKSTHSMLRQGNGASLYALGLALQRTLLHPAKQVSQSADRGNDFGELVCIG